MTTTRVTRTARRRRRPATPLERFELQMLARGMSERTITDRLRTIGNIAGVMPPESLDLMEVSRWLANPNWSQASRCTHWSELSAWFQFLMDDGVRDDFPMPPRPRQPVRYARPVAPENVRRLLAQPRLHHRTRVMIKLAVYAGLRVHEIAKVRAEDIDVVGGSIVVHGKGDGRHVLPLHDELLAIVHTMPTEGWWFPSCKPGVGYDPKQHVHGKSVSDVIGRAMRRAGVPGTPHGLRHFFATALVDNNVNVRVVQELMRHRSLQTTQIYTRISDVQRRAAINTLVLPAGPSDVIRTD